MSVIAVNRSHSLDRDHARSSAEHVVERLAQEYAMKYRWEGDAVKFKGSGAKGQIQVTECVIEVKVELNFMLRPFKGRIQQEIESYLEEFCG